MKSNSYKEMVELYNSGITNEKELAQILHLTLNSISTYISRANREGKISKKSKYQQIIELYNSGTIDENELAQRLNVSKQTICNYINRANKEGKIKLEKKRKRESKYEQLIELYNSGMPQVKKLAATLNINETTVYNYISRASRQGRLIKIESTYEKIIELYNSGITDSKELAQKLGLAEDTLYKYINKANKQGRISKIKSAYEQLIELYNSGITDSKELAQILKLKLKTVNAYACKARDEGRVAKRKNKYEEIVQLYNSGIHQVEKLAEMLNINEKTAYSYISRANQEERIPKIESKYEQLIKLYNSGITNGEKLAEMLELKIDTILHYITKAKKEGKIKIVNLQPSQKTKSAKDSESARQPQIAKIPQAETKSQDTNGLQKPKISQELLERELKDNYPYVVAQKLGISPKEIYDFLDSMTEEQKVSLRTKLLRNNYVWKKIKRLKRSAKADGKEIDINDVIKEIEEEAEGMEKIELSRFFFVMGQPRLSQRTLNRIIYNEYEDIYIKQNARTELENVKTEILVQDIRKEVSEKKEKYGVSMSYDYLWRKYKASTTFLVQILGREQTNKTISE